jgi:DNA-binding transcriptional LysR family regulator
METLTMVGTGEGVCLMPADVISLPHPDAKFIPLTEKIAPIRFTAAWRRDDDREIISRLIATLHNSKKNNGKKSVATSTRIDRQQ